MHNVFVCQSALIKGNFEWIAVDGDIDQDDDIENKQALLVEVLPAGNFKRVSTRTIMTLE